MCTSNKRGVEIPSVLRLELISRRRRWRSEWRIHKGYVEARPQQVNEGYPLGRVTREKASAHIRTTTRRLRKTA